MEINEVLNNIKEQEESEEKELTPSEATIDDLISIMESSGNARGSVRRQDKAILKNISQQDFSFLKQKIAEYERIQSSIPQKPIKRR